MTIFRASRTLAILATVAVAAVTAAPSALAARGSGASFRPSVVLRELHATMVERTEFGPTTITLHWRPERLRRFGAGGRPTERSMREFVRGIESHGSIHADGSVHRVSTTRNTATVEPDGAALMGWDLFDVAWPLIARVRSGGAPLAAVTVDGRRLLRGTMRLAPHDCAGLAAGARTVWFNPSTLVPARILERRGGRTIHDWKVSTRAGRPGDWGRRPILGRGFPPTDEGFHRSTLAVAADRLGREVSLPTRVPGGFRVAQTGWAPRGSFLGPEASFPRSGGVFFRTWHRGLEPLHLTVRSARATLVRDWDMSDPFGAECMASREQDVEIGSVTGRYAAGEEGMPHLWWRRSRVLYTLAGPLSAEQLARIARSIPA